MDKETIEYFVSTSDGYWGKGATPNKALADANFRLLDTESVYLVMGKGLRPNAVTGGCEGEELHAAVNIKLHDFYPDDYDILEKAEHICNEHGFDTIGSKLEKCICKIAAAEYNASTHRTRSTHL